MQTTGIIRKIDDLGRIVLPKELRKYLNINTGDDFQILVDNDKIILEKYSKLKNYQDDILKLINSYIGIYKYNIYFCINENILGTNEKLQLDIINLIQERKLYINDNISKLFLSKNIILEGKIVIYPLVVDSDLLGTIIIVGNDKIDNLVNASKIINNIIRTLIINMV